MGDVVNLGATDAERIDADMAQTWAEGQARVAQGVEEGRRRRAVVLVVAWEDGGYTASCNGATHELRGLLDVLRERVS